MLDASDRWIFHRIFFRMAVKIKPAGEQKEGRHDIEKTLRKRSGSSGDAVGGDERGAANTARCDGMETRDIQVPRPSVGRTTRNVLSHA